MFPSLDRYALAAVLGLVPLLWAVSPARTSSAGTSPARTSPARTERGAAHEAETTAPALQRTATAAAREAVVECRTARAELERLRQSCDVEVQEFEACRAARPAWRDVELFSCGFEMSTSLTRGDVSDPASIEDCGGSTEQGLRANCPVPACEAEVEEAEAELEALEETAARDAC